MNFAKDLANVQSLAAGQACTVFWAEGGGGEVTREGDVLVLREVPQFGGSYMSEHTFALGEAEELVELAYTWT